MKYLMLICAFLCLLIPACGDAQSELEAELEDFDKEEVVELIENAIERRDLWRRGKSGEELAYAPRSKEPLTGYSKDVVSVTGAGWISYSYLFEEKERDHGTLVKMYEYKEGESVAARTYGFLNGDMDTLRLLEVAKKQTNGKDNAAYWYTNGNKAKENVHYSNGSLVQKTWYRNGQPESEANLKINAEGRYVPHGWVRVWDEDGTLTQETEWENGEKIF